MTTMVDLETSMTEPMFASYELMMAVHEAIRERGFVSHLSDKKVVPFVQVNPFPNKWIPIGAPRWIAMCPECPGSEVIPEKGYFVCGSCGAEAEVDRSGL